MLKDLHKGGARCTDLSRDSGEGPGLAGGQHNNCGQGLEHQVGFRGSRVKARGRVGQQLKGPLVQGRGWITGDRTKGRGWEDFRTLEPGTRAQEVGPVV